LELFETASAAYSGQCRSGFRGEADRDSGLMPIRDSNRMPIRKGGQPVTLIGMPGKAIGIGGRFSTG